MCEVKEMVVDWAIDVMRDIVSVMCESHESWVSLRTSWEIIEQGLSNREY